MKSIDLYKSSDGRLWFDAETDTGWITIELRDVLDMIKQLVNHLEED